MEEAWNYDYYYDDDDYYDMMLEKKQKELVKKQEALETHEDNFEWEQVRDDCKNGGWYNRRHKKPGHTYMDQRLYEHTELLQMREDRLTNVRNRAWPREFNASEYNVATGKSVKLFWLAEDAARVSKEGAVTRRTTRTGKNPTTGTNFNKLGGGKSKFLDYYGRHGGHAHDSKQDCMHFQNDELVVPINPGKKTSARTRRREKKQLEQQKEDYLAQEKDQRKKEDKARTEILYAEWAKK